MKQYLGLCQDILENGIEKTDRTGTGTMSVFGRQMRFDLQEGFPLLTTKKVHLKGILHELLWFLNGDTNIKYLIDNGVNIWVPDAYREYKYLFTSSDSILLSQDEFIEKIKTDIGFAELHGDLGRVYGKQWRDWQSWNDGSDYVTSVGIDQISNVIQQIKTNPDSRRLLVNAYNVGELDSMALPPCHTMFQFYVSDNKLSCMFSMRSTDTFLGLPYNIASYAALTMMVAQVCNLELGELIYSGADVHIYNNLVDQVRLQLTREPRPLPKLHLNSTIKNIFDFKIDDFTLVGYDPHPTIKGKVSV